MAGNWRNEERYQRDRDRDRWSSDDQRRRDRDSRDARSRDHWDDYAFGRNERRGEYGSRDRESGYGGMYGEGYREGYGQGYGSWVGEGRGRSRFGQPYGGSDDTWGNGWRGEGQTSPSRYGPGWGDQHGRMGYRTFGGAYGAGYAGGQWPGEEYGDYGYGYGRGAGNRPARGNDRDFWDRASDEVASWFGDDDAARRRRRDEREDHRGRGPKGYTRSDDRIREDVSDALSDDSMVDASDISVTVSGSEVTLNGTVQNRSAKRRAEDCADNVSGVKHVQNNLRVKETTAGTSQGAGATRSGGISGTATSTGAKTTV